ncbi:23S rRNA (guanosine(2251)-2'-O)-methyltransferase RlmB [Sulfurimonas sp. MAG313]|nr:23S rRNA (guanosine(2251)-2'-O)-methyltransferase RlmB [Sulfurimonas sp. MAG313]MDF1882269.1 23S rRNA (guanosine(2251)-2'-O)-methyltransferase RlmB [Sulfurimonas sp. MAG313]
MIIYGKQPVYYLIEKHPSKVKTVFVSKELDKKEYSRLMRMDFELKRIPDNAAQSMSKTGNHQGFLAEVDDLELYDLKDLSKPEFVLVLAGITDMGNMGAIIRSAYGLGIDAIVVTGVKHFQAENVVRSSAGAAYDMPIVHEHNLYDVMNELKLDGFTLYGATMDGEDIRHVKCTAKRALIMGNEAQGIPTRAIKKLDIAVSIEMANDFDSLNVSVASAILMDRMRN